MSRRFCALALFALGLCTPGFAADPMSAPGAPDAPVGKPPPPPLTRDEALTGFYTAYLKIGVHGVPTDAKRKRLEPFISSALDKLLIDALAAEKSYKELTRGSEAPLIEGDPFTSLFEGATAFKLGQCGGDDIAAHCSVDFIYNDDPPDPTHWSDLTFLINTETGWRLDDVAYGAPFDRANKGRLVERLNAAIATAAEEAAAAPVAQAPPQAPSGVTASVKAPKKGMRAGPPKLRRY
jgi:hypothetical protein